METTIERIEKKMNQVFAQIDKNDREYKKITRMLYEELVKKTKIIKSLSKSNGSTKKSSA